MKISLAFIFTVLLGGCAFQSTVVPVDYVYDVSSCGIKVYQTKAQAEKFGSINELVVITGTSSMSFDHSIRGAVKKNVDKLCGTGSTHAYIRSQHTEYSGGLAGVSHVTLVGIRYVQ